jgi:hypothetical protein
MVEVAAWPAVHYQVAVLHRVLVISNVLTGRLPEVAFTAVAEGFAIILRFWSKHQ